MNIETHLLTPFIFSDTKMLMLGSFPPKKEKWTMDFYYPNFQNDMWRIFGIVFFDDKEYFLSEDQKKFDKEKICSFLQEYKIGLGDAAYKVIRQRENASDKFLEIVEALDFEKILTLAPLCNTIITTGEKSGEIIQEYFDINKLPKIGEREFFGWKGRNMQLYRVPSSSRAYPKSLNDKSQIYRCVFDMIKKNPL